MAPANFSAAEYQLIESVHHGLLGRLYSPAPLNTENSKRTIIRTERNNTVVYFKTTASDHLAIASQCKASNLLANRVRTNQLLLKVKQGIIDPMGTPTPAELAATLATAPAKAPTLAPTPTQVAQATRPARVAPPLLLESLPQPEPQNQALQVVQTEPSVTQDQAGLGTQLGGYSLKRLRALCAQLGMQAKAKTKSKLIARILLSKNDSQLIDNYFNTQVAA